MNIEPTCFSCGVPLRDHLGLHGTCRQLQEARAEIERLTAERNKLREANRTETERAEHAEHEATTLAGEVLELRATVMSLALTPHTGGIKCRLCGAFGVYSLIHKPGCLAGEGTTR
jgi:hypothetical protein